MSALGMTFQEAKNAKDDFLVQWQHRANQTRDADELDEVTRRNRLDQLRGEAVARLEEIQRQYQLGRRYALTEWRRRQFSPPLDAQAPQEVVYAVQRSYREAYDRAKDVATARRAADLLWRAYMTNDNLLARAVALVADVHGWTDVLEHYAALQPGASSLLTERRAQYAGVDSESHRLEAEFAQSLDSVKRLTTPKPQATLVTPPAHPGTLQRASGPLGPEPRPLAPG